mmetsp:Transcript_27517/g.88902  ORF Transcript_27517/g.88902 Transcript_27517/m.88902 type:complete len:258 (+) Transcript_27517:785-1558(+)
MSEDVVGEGLVRVEAAVFPDLVLKVGDAAAQFGHSRGAGAGGRLVRRHDHFLEAEGGEDRVQSHHRDGRRAVGIRHELGRRAEFAVHLGDDQGHVRAEPQGRRVVDDDALLRDDRGNLLGVLQGEVPRRRQEDDVEAAHFFHVELPHGDVSPLSGLHRLPPLRPEEGRGALHGKPPRLQDPQNLTAHGPRRTHDPHLRIHPQAPLLRHAQPSTQAGTRLTVKRTTLSGQGGRKRSDSSGRENGDKKDPHEPEQDHAR